MAIEVPPALMALDSKPGREWTEEDYAQVSAWWAEPKQLKRLAAYAALYLGKGATVQDVEDAVVSAFFLLDQARRSYKPGGPAFCVYFVNVCFKHHCIREGEKLRARQQREQPLLALQSEDTVGELEIEEERGYGNPLRCVQGKAFLADLEMFLNHAKLPKKHRDAFALRYLEDLPYDQIAARMQAPVGSVKGWLNRATHTARQFFAERGWDTGRTEA